MWLMIVKFFLNLFPDRDQGMGELGKAGDGVLIAPNYVSFIDPYFGVFLPEKVPFAIERRLTKRSS